MRNRAGYGSMTGKDAEMAPEEQPGEGNSTSTPAGGEPQGQQGQQQDPPAGEAGTGGQPQASEPVITKDTKIPDDHPLVKALAKANGQVAELAEARAQAAKATQLQAELDKRPTTEAVETLQKRYDRLEAFLLGAGGDLAKALDSRTFTRDLFESDKDVETLVKDWNKAHPSATSQALGGAPAPGGAPKSNMNDLLRAAAQG